MLFVLLYLKRRYPVGKVTQWTQKEIDFLLDEVEKKTPYATVASLMSTQFKRTFTSDSIRNKVYVLGKSKKAVSKPLPTVGEQVEEHRLKKQVRTATKREKQLAEEVERLERDRSLWLAMDNHKTSYRITPSKSPKVEASAFLVMSDWHIDETVKPGTVNGMNEMNEEIANDRIQKFFNNSIALLKMAGATTKINKVVLAMLGDFISGNIHDELMEGNWCSPIEAIIWVEERLVAGIKLMLKEVPHDFVAVCHTGNHSRITQKKHISTQVGNSTETLLYHHLKSRFKDEPRIDFQIAEGYLTYLEIGDKVIRLHHGDGFRYNGGVGDIYPGALRWIGKSNGSRRADLDVFGHHHGYRNGGCFICNDSLIGYTAYAAERGFSFRRPSQRFFLYTKRGEVIAEHPVFLD